MSVGDQRNGSPGATQPDEWSDREVVDGAPVSDEVDVDHRVGNVLREHGENLIDAGRRRGAERMERLVMSGRADSLGELMVSGQLRWFDAQHLLGTGFVAQPDSR